jgi:hypothetical protein
MKFFYILIFLILLSCNTTKKEYVCGDHLCVDKKEFNEYFSENLIIEISVRDKKKKKKSIDLVKLNTDSNVKKKNDNKNSKKKERILKKNEKVKLKKQKVRLLEERKIREIEEKNKVKQRKITKIQEKNEQNLQNEKSVNRKMIIDKVVDTIGKQKKPPKKITEKTISMDSVKTENVKSICDEIKDCDIDKIAELLIKKGKDKPFPNMSSN